MSLFVISVVLILTVLFIILSAIPLLPDQNEKDSSRHSSVKTKTSH